MIREHVQNPHATSNIVRCAPGSRWGTGSGLAGDFGKSSVVPEGAIALGAKISLRRERRMFCRGQVFHAELLRMGCHDLSQLVA